MKKLKLQTKLFIGALIALVGVLTYLFINKKPKTSSQPNENPIIAGLPDETQNHIIDQAKKVAAALGTSPTSNIFQRMTENEVKAFEIIKNNLSNKGLLKLSYESYTSRDLEIDTKEYLRSNQISELQTLGFY